MPVPRCCFNGDGRNAATLRERIMELPFDSNVCGEQPGVTCDDPTSGFPAGNYPVSVLNRYELIVTDTDATIVDHGAKVGDTAELAVDYRDSELLILTTQNLDYSTLATNSNWLYLNGQPFLSRAIYDCRLQQSVAAGPLACRPVADTSLAISGFPGLHTRWFGTPSGDNSSNSLWTSLHVSYIDLRTRSFEYSKAITEDDTELMEGGASRVEYWISHEGVEKQLFQEQNGVLDCFDDVFLFMSPYGKAAFPTNLFTSAIPPTRGQYTFISNCVTVAPVNTQMSRGVDRYRTFYTGGLNQTSGLYFNYLSTGDNLGDFGIFDSAISTPTKLIVR